jgi:hypothetical protein
MAEKTKSRDADAGAPADAPIFTQFTGAEGAAPLETFLANAEALTEAERLTLVNQAILLLEGDYVHLPLKRAMHAVDPLQRLRLLRHRHTQLTETRFHDIGQRYYGPVVLITNARCYSTTDFFAAGFQDHGIGPVLGVDNNTGAGGANVWEHKLLLRLAGAPLAPLPRGANMRVSVRRSLRVGAQAGTQLEDLGVVPDARHRLTRRDLLERNIDLIEKAATMLAGKPLFALDATASKVGGNLRLVLATTNLDRVDIEIDGRPQRSIDIAGTGATVDLPTALSSGVATLRGFKDGSLAAARKVAF